MNTSTTIATPSLALHKADRVGVAASVLCAIHCAIAPVLLIFLPTFGRVWAHPASHILVAIFVVPLAAFSIYKGYQTHRRRWILISACIGIFFVLIGAMLPAFTKGSSHQEASSSLASSEIEAPSAPPEASAAAGGCDSCDGACDKENEDATTPVKTGETKGDGGCESDCDQCASKTVSEGGSENPKNKEAAVTGCVDNCCPSLLVDESGNTSLHIPPAAIVTTLGGMFLIIAHIGNLCSCGHACCSGECATSENTEKAKAFLPTP